MFVYEREAGSACDKGLLRSPSCEFVITPLQAKCRVSKVHLPKRCVSLKIH